MSSTSNQQALARLPSAQALPSHNNEDYPLSAVLQAARKSIWSLVPLLIGFTLYSGTLFAGGKVGTVYRFCLDLGGLIAGNLILGVYAALSYIAAKTRLNTVFMTRFSFGNYGLRWVDFLLGFTQIGWYAWGSALIAELLNKLVRMPSSYNWLVILVVTYFFYSTDWLSRFALPAILILIVWCLAIASNDIGGFAGLQAITIVVGTLIGDTQATNWSRVNSGGTLISTLTAFFFTNGLLIFSGTFCALVYSKGQFPSLEQPQPVFD